MRLYFAEIRAKHPTRELGHSAGPEFETESSNDPIPPPHLPRKCASKMQYSTSYYAETITDLEMMDTLPAEPCVCDGAR